MECSVELRKRGRGNRRTFGTEKKERRQKQTGNGRKIDKINERERIGQKVGGRKKNRLTIKKPIAQDRHRTKTIGWMHRNMLKRQQCVIKKKDKKKIFFCLKDNLK
uniref:Uncharacterized protein n=1 Tax=Cacopsylla melanoneura TaxID=428564 RepID=A0A8D8XHZ4_9HEMI